MATFAVLTGDRVINLILAETLQDAELATGCTCIEYTPENPASINDVYNGTNFITPKLEVTND